MTQTRNSSPAPIISPLIVLVLINVSFLYFAVAVIYSSFSSIGTDGVFYTLMAKSITLGHGLTVYGVPHAIYSPLLPILIAPFYALGFPLETAAHIPGIIFSSLVIIGTYFLGKRMHSPQVGLLSALFLATSGVYLWGAAISPTPQIISGFFALVAFLCLLKVEQVKSQKLFWHVAGAGVAIGLAYLARPEYFFLFFLALGHLVCISWRARGGKSALSSALALFIAFIVTIGPYLFYLHETLGYWTISGRGSEMALIVASESYEAVDESSGTGLATVVAPPILEKSAMSTALQDFPMLVKRLADGLVNTEHTLLRLFGVFGVVAFGFGLRFLMLARKWNELALFGVFMLPIVLIAFAQGGSPNYLVQYFFLLTPIMAIGLSDFVSELAKLHSWSRKVHSFALGLFAAVLALYFLIPLLQNILFLPADYRDIEYKEVGLWMHEHIPDIETEVVVSRKPEPTFYAQSLWAIVPSGKDVAGVHESMKQWGQHYLIVDDRSMGPTRPELVDLFVPEKVTPYFTLVYQTDYYGKRALLYRIVE